MLRAYCVVLFLSMVKCQNYERQYVDSLKKDLSVRSWRRASGGEFENLFTVYDPSFLSVAWPKIRNGVHLLLEPECWSDVSVFFRELAEGRAWAYDVADASGRYPSALFAGERYWLGSKRQCLQMSDEFLEFGHNETLTALRSNDYISSILNREKYFGSEEEEWRWVMQDEVMQRLLAAEHRPPYALLYSALQLQVNVTRFTMYKWYDITLGVCLPRSCSADDVESIVSLSVSLNDNLRSNRTVPRRTALNDVRQIDGSYDFFQDTGALIVITVTLMLLTLTVIATIVDLNLFKCFPYSKKSMSFDLPKQSNELSLVDELKRKHIELMNVEAGPDGGAKKSAAPLALDASAERAAGSCARCGKYRRQCPGGRRAASTAACPRLQYSSFASLSTRDKRNAFPCKLLLCFSLTSNLRRIFNKNTANKDLAAVHVLKIFATLWIIFVHVAVVASYASSNSGDLNKREDVYYILATGTIAFDTLFFVSGLISAHHLFYLKSRYSVRELVSFGGACGNVMQFVCFITNRVIRVLPVYLWAAAAGGAAARWARATRPLVLPDADHAACDLYWWRNALYITNAYPDHEQCLQIAWFLSTETQLHAVGALACVASGAAGAARGAGGSGGAGGAGAARTRLVAALSASLALAAVAADVSEAIVEEHVYRSSFALYARLVARGWARVAPYAAGALAGRLVHAGAHSRAVTKPIARLLWTASLSLAASSLAAPRVAAAWAGAWLHAAWAAALIWPALVVSTKYSGSLRKLCSWVWLSRLSGCALLAQAVLVRLLLLPDRPLCSDLVCISQYFVWVTFMSFVAALFLALLIEMPVCALLRRLSESAST